MLTHFGFIAGRTAVVVLVSVAAIIALPWWASAAYAAALAGRYAWSLAIKPVLPCWNCGGQGFFSERFIWTWGSGPCWRCGGRKVFIRRGVKVFTPARARRLAREMGTADYRRPRRIP